MSSKLLREPHSEAMVQISVNADTLSNLLSSIESLRKDVSILQGKLSTVSAELVTLQKNTGVACPFFAKLPVEIRLMIWRYALTSIPQIHILGTDFCSRSMVNSVAESCKEAWTLLKSLELDYLRIENVPVGSARVNSKSYVNLDIDTFWLIDPAEAIIPWTIEPYCGKCVKKSGPVTRGSSAWGVGTICPRIDSTVFFPIRTLAINASSWENPQPGGSDDGSVEILWRCKVRELLIVVGDIPPFPPPHTVLTEPYESFPIELLKFFDLGFSPDVYLATGYWFILEANIVEAMQEFKNQRAIDRRKKCEAEGITLEELNEYDYETLYDLSNWKIPTVKLVQAKSDGRQ